MPIYMDRHDVSETVTAENVAQLHQQDLKIQHKFGCRGLTYWFDEKRKTAFCLVEASEKRNIIEMHNKAHGEIPHKIIEVEPNIVESFLGRIEDPAKAVDVSLNIINDPAFRTIMIADLKLFSLDKLNSEEFKSSIQKYNKSVLKIINSFNGRVVKQNSNNFLISFDSVTKAVLCALNIQSKFKMHKKYFLNANLNLKIALSAGVPVTENETFFEDAIKLAKIMNENTIAEVVLSSEVKDLFISENINANKLLQDSSVFSMTLSDEKFLNQLVNFIEKNWNKPELKADDFCKPLGYSKSRLYRKMIKLTGKSPNTFLNDYRLNQSLIMLNKQSGNISEIAFETGFSSLSYFSKCFFNKYQCLPSNYIRCKQTMKRSPV